MNRLKKSLAVYWLIGSAFFGLTAAANAQTGRNERGIRDTLRSLNSKTDDFRYSLDNELGRNIVSRDEEDQINGDLQNFNDRLKQFGDKLDRRRDNSDDVRNVLTAAQSINDFLNAKRFGSLTQKDWTEIRTLLSRLASNYQVSWNWDGGGGDYNRPANGSANNDYPAANAPSANASSANDSYSSNLTGTYQIDQTRSENAQEIAERVTRGSNAGNSQNAQSDLESKLEAPEQVVIEVRGSQITLASSNAAQLTFTADGRDRTETTADGKTIRLRVTLRGQELTVSSVGGETDYTIIFTPIDNGKALKVTRRITTDYLRETVFAESIYTKTGATAQFDKNPNYDNDNGNYSSNDSSDNRTNSGNYPANAGNYPTVKNGRSGQFIVPNGTIITGITEKNIDTKISQTNDRFTLLVQSPNEYRGAIVEGYISGVNRSGKVSGRSQITFNFERITLSNGSVYDFNGFLQSIADENGKTVKVDTEGTAQGDNQTKETVKRGGIGAGIGAVIGAIASGGKGAAIGAIIGGGAGAGSVLAQGKDDLQLKSGSTMTVQASSPVR
ncbi:MAG: hypothetical protein M3T96_05760 [Acidobacteriota bacterium]|nr:hypothetical protein [Acidobacteriota bacterium]